MPLMVPATATHRTHRTRRPGVVTAFLVVAMAAALVPLLPAVAGAAPGDPPPIPPPLVVELTPGGFVPEAATLTVGQTLVVHNATGATREVASADGAVGSGPIAGDELFVLAFPAAATGHHDLADDVAPDPHHLDVSVGLLGLAGNPLSPISYGIPTSPPPRPLFDPHPELTVVVARNRVLLTFLPGATIGMANDALAAGGLTPVGGYPRFGTVVAEVAGNPTPTDPTSIQPALDAVRGLPGIRSASFEIAMSREASIPRPVVPDPGAPARPWRWEAAVDDLGTATGFGGNWALETSRFPQAWNAMDAVLARLPHEAPRPDTVVLDSGFLETHPDLTGSKLHLLCSTATPAVCGTNDDIADKDHGTSTAGIIGAAFDRGPAGAGASPGLSGADPTSRLHLVPAFAVEDEQAQVFHGVEQVAFTDLTTVIDLILAQRNTRFPNLRTINYSLGPVSFYRNADKTWVWNDVWNTRTCGPGNNDDSTPAATGRCFPWNADKFITEYRQFSLATEPIVAALAQANTLLVASAGNESRIFCNQSPIPAGGCTDFAPTPAASVLPFAHVAEAAVGDSPLLIVEAYGEDLARSGFSNIGGMVSAPGDGVLAPTALPTGLPGYDKDFRGTSASAPYVTALASYLTALWPGAGWEEIRRAIIDSAYPDVTNGGAPRIDAFAALLRMPDGLETLLDSNDPSLDGNRRVIYDDEGRPVGVDTVAGENGARASAPDGVIDMADFRRYRDAYLATCHVGDLNCPEAGQLGLDGAGNHPKKDGNQDRCFSVVEQCDFTEGVFSRFDFNGDATLEPRSVSVPIGPDGNPLQGDDEPSLSDLDVFALGWPADAQAQPDLTEGWPAVELERLLRSADVEVRLDQLWEEGAIEAKVSVFTADNDAPQRSFLASPSGDSRFFTVPLLFPDGATEDLVQVRVEATMPDQTDPVPFLSDAMPAKAGSDLVVRPCTGQLLLAADQASLPLGGSTTLRATLNDCFGRPIANEDLEFAIVEGPDGGSITDVTPTNGQGMATATYTHPVGSNGPTRIGVAFHNQIKGFPLADSVDLDVAPQQKVHYRFRQSILEYERTSTNDWGPNEDDCDGPTDSAAPRIEHNCFRSVQTFAANAIVFHEPIPGQVETTVYDFGKPVIERRGTIVPNDNGGATVVEQARIIGVRDGEITNGQAGAVMNTDVTQWRPGAPGDVETYHLRGWGLLADQPDAVGPDPAFTPPVTMEFPGIHFVETGDSFQVSGLHLLSTTLVHEQNVFARSIAGLQDDYEVHPDVPVRRYDVPGSNPPDFSVGPRVDETGFKYGPDPDVPLTFTADSNPSYCAVVERTFDDEPGYWSDADPIMDPGYLRDPDVQVSDRRLGDRAAPRHTGHITSRFEFSARLSGPDIDEVEPEPYPTVCPNEEEPISFDHAPTPVLEGTPTTFTDTSPFASEATGHLWTFGDGSDASADDQPVHVFEDSVNASVAMTVTDGQGVDHTSVPETIVVANADPTVALEGIVGPPEAPRLQIRVDDPSPIDRLQLDVRLTSPTPGFPAGQPQQVGPPPDPADPGSFLPGPYVAEIALPTGLAPKAYFVTVTVTDKDGGTAKVSLSLGVTSTGTDAGTAAASTVAAPSAAADAPSADAPTAGPITIPAFVLSSDTVDTGATVGLRNASRTDGVAAGAAVLLGDGRPPLALAAGASTTPTWLDAGGFDLGLIAGGTTAALTVTVVGPPVPPTITAIGPASAAQGAMPTVRATVTASGGPVQGATVRFSLASAPGITATGTTAADGRAEAALVVTGSAGPTELVVEVLPAGPSQTAPFEVIANGPPAVDAGGPYTLSPGAPLDLHAVGSDPDVADLSMLVFDWDLDADGEFDDANGAGVGLTAADVITHLCGGVPLGCDAGDSRTISVRVQDPKGGAATETATVHFIRDFAVEVTPANAVLVAGSWSTFTVAVTTDSGFDQPVQLSAPGLPSGISAQFTPPTLTPDGTSILTVFAPDSTPDQEFPLVVRGVGGSLTRESTSAVDVDFGLIPVCFGTVRGRITDRETGEPMVGVGVAGGVTDENGAYFDDRVPLGFGNSAVFRSFIIGEEGYHDTTVTGTVACGVETTLDATLLRHQFGALEGRVTGRSADGLTDLGPVAGASILGLNGPATDAGGNFSRSGIALGSENAPRPLNIVASPPPDQGYFASPSTSVTLVAGTVVRQDLVLRKVCYASARVQVIDARTGLPFPGTFVNGLPTDANGVIVIDQVPLGAPDNRPRNLGLTARTPEGIFPVATQSKSVAISRCGGVTPVVMALTQPHNVVARLDLTVVDDETGLPIPFARTSADFRYFADTDANGHVAADFLMGVDVAPVRDIQVNGGHNDYWDLPAQVVTVREGETTTATIRLLRRKLGAVEGTVRDRLTGAPLAGMSVGGIETGPDGRYRIEVPLGQRNSATETSLFARDPGFPRMYWDSDRVTATVSADAVGTADFTMLRVCAGGTIRGRVRNALTGEPLEGARVFTQSASDDTDAEGRFVLADLPVSTDNRPQGYSVTASKEGFLSLTKSVTVFCGADIVVEFGNEDAGVGTIAGTVTDGGGLPVQGVFVGTGFGGAATTNAAGTYTIANAPVGDDGQPRDWPVQATPPVGSGLAPQTKTATVRVGESTTVDFRLEAPANEAPTAIDLAYEVVTGASVDVFLGGSDPNGDPLTFAVADTPDHGDLSGSGPVLTYTADDGALGTDAFTYTVSDGALTSAPATVTLNIVPPNRPPLAVITIERDGLATVPEGDAVYLTSTASTDPDSAIVERAWDLDDDGQFDDELDDDTWVARYDEETQTVRLRVTDDEGLTGEASIVLTWVNGPPEVELEADQEEVLAGEEAWFWLYAEDPGEDDLTATIDWGDGSAPAPADLDAGEAVHVFAFGGTYTVRFEACDDDDACASTEVSILVEGDPPPSTSSTTTTSTTTTSTTSTTTTSTTSTTTTSTSTTSSSTTTSSTTTTTEPTTTTTEEPTTTTTEATTITTGASTSTSVDPSTTSSPPSTDTPGSGSVSVVPTVEVLDASITAGGGSGTGGAGAGAGAVTTTLPLTTLPLTGSSRTLPMVALVFLVLGALALTVERRLRRAD